MYVYVSGATTLNGSLVADGWSTATAAGGGGSGGSVWLYAAGSLAGSGSIYARGGASVVGNGGGGGGGRVAVYYGGLTATITSSTAGGTGANTGSTGTIYTLLVNQTPNAPTTLGPAALTDGSTTGTTNPIFTFSLTDPDGADTLKYRIQIDDTSNFSSPVVDYTSVLAAQGSRTFQVGQSAGSGTYSVGSSGQTLSDGSYYWRVKAIDAAAAESSYATANSGAVAFAVDSSTRLLSFESTTGSGLESVTATSIRILLNATHFETVTVAYAVTAGTATGSGTDYTLAAGTATIAIGQTSTTIPLVVVNDSIDETDETLTIALSTPTNAVIGSNTSTVYTILDNDVAGVTINPTSRALSEGGASSTYTVVLDAQPTSTVQVLLATDGQVTLSTTTLTFTSADWSVAQTVTVNALQDSSIEGTHTGTVTHAANVPSGFAYGYQTLSGISDFTATIADDETASIAVAPTSLAVTEGESGSYSVVLGAAPTTTVQILVGPASGLGVSASVLTFTSSNWNVPQTVTVTPVNDTSFTAQTRTLAITQTVSTTIPAYAALAVSTVTVTITDDESSGGGAAGAAVPGTVATYRPVPPVPALPAESFRPLPDVPGVITIVNPDDVAQVVARFHGGTRDTALEARAKTLVESDLRAFGLRVLAADAAAMNRLAVFLGYGLSAESARLGMGERRAVLRDAFETMRTPNVPVTDLERLVRGQIPQTRNLAEERRQVARALPTFRAIFDRVPDFLVAQDNLAWNTLLYRIRFPRDLAKEREGIQAFRQVFRRTPADPFQWAVVRLLGYVRTAR